MLLWLLLYPSTLLKKYTEILQNVEFCIQCYNSKYFAQCFIQVNIIKIKIINTHYIIKIVTCTLFEINFFSLIITFHFCINNININSNMVSE